MALEEEAQEAFRGRCSSSVAPARSSRRSCRGLTPDLERLILYGRLLPLEVPTGDNDPMPQLSTSVQLTHLRIAVTSDEAFTLEGADEPGTALPGEGEGAKAEPVPGEGCPR